MSNKENNHLTVVMYHYVRNLQESRYPLIKGLDANLFEEQIEYILKHYNVVTMEDVIGHINGKHKFPENPLLLTFDDGYSDHFNTVFPILYNKGIQGSFFAPVRAIEKNELLDVNKIHFILASGYPISFIIEEIKNYLSNYKIEYNLFDFEYYFNKLAIANRFDPAEVIFVKRLLQVELPSELRLKITTQLFEKVIGLDQSVFAKELYMSKEQMKCMVKAGMHIGSHCYNHIWMDSMTKEEQVNELTQSIRFVKEIYGDDYENWTICYPYGAYNQDTLDLLGEYNCSAGFTTEVDIAKVCCNNKFTLARLDTNDLPKDKNSSINSWFIKQSKI